MKNITLKHYISLPDTADYDIILEHLNPKNIFGGNQMNIDAMPYANVKYCMRLLQKITNWNDIQALFEICFDITEKEFFNVNISEFFAARKFLIEEFKSVTETENRMFSSVDTDSHLWKMAGSDKLKAYTDTLPLIHLGKLFGQYPFDLGRKPYSEIFSLLIQLKVHNEVEKEYGKLAAAK